MLSFWCSLSSSLWRSNHLWRSDAHLDAFNLHKQAMIKQADASCEDAAVHSGSLTVGVRLTKARHDPDIRKTHKWELMSQLFLLHSIQIKQREINDFILRLLLRSDRMIVHRTALFTGGRTKLLWSQDRETPEQWHCPLGRSVHEPKLQEDSVQLIQPIITLDV